MVVNDDNDDDSDENGDEENGLPRKLLWS